MADKRIFTTHAGSLPRPARLVELYGVSDPRTGQREAAHRISNHYSRSAEEGVAHSNQYQHEEGGYVLDDLSMGDDERVRPQVEDVGELPS